MVDQITANKVEYQDELVDRIEKHFGSEWVYENDNGNPAISRKVLAQFRKLHACSIEWDRSDRAWSVTAVGDR
jgi:hypothetical protein